MKPAISSRFRFLPLALTLGLVLLQFGCAQPTPSIHSAEPLGPAAPPATSTPVAATRPSPPSEPAPRPPAGDAPATTLAILYTNDVRGYLDPCG